MPHLRYQDDGAELSVELSARGIVIGRLPECDVVVPKKYVSRRHARVFVEGKKVVVEDLQSAAGTFVNRVRVIRQVLEFGDQIRIGDFVFTCERGDAPKAATSNAKKLMRVVASSGPSGRTLTKGGVLPFGPSRESTNTGESDESDSSTDLNKLPTEEILAEHRVDAGELMRKTMSARSLDLSVPRPDSSSDGQMLALVRISDEINRCPDVATVCRRAVEMAMRATAADRGSLALRDPAEKKLVFLPAAQVVLTKGKLVEGPVRVSRTFVERSVAERMALIARDTDADEAMSMSKSVVALDIRSMLCVPLWDGAEYLGYLYLDSIGLGRTFSSRDLDLLCVIGYHAAAAIARLQLTERIRETESQRQNLARFFSSEVIRQIEGGHDLSPREQEVTILFSDIEGFARISEGLAPAKLREFLETYFDRMTEILVDRHGGTLDKYIGDSIMALFGAPVSRGAVVDARAAVSAAVDMRDALLQIRKERKEIKELRELHMRIGINTGKVLAGMIGSRRRVEYSVIGDAVNVASRLESTGEADKIQIGEATYEAIGDAFVCEYAGERQVKNRAQPVKSWWVVRAR